MNENNEVVTEDVETLAPWQAQPQGEDVDGDERPGQEASSEDSDDAKED